MELNRFGDTTIISEAEPRVSIVELRRTLRVGIQELVRLGLDKDAINLVISCSQTMDDRMKQIAMLYIGIHFSDSHIHDPDTISNADTLQIVNFAIVEVTNTVSQLQRHWNGAQDSTYA